MKVTVVGLSEALDRVTVNSASTVPALPSVTDTSFILTTTSSSLVIVPVAATPPTVRSYISSSSFIASSTLGIVTVKAVTPAGTVTSIVVGLYVTLFVNSAFVGMV